MNILPWLIEATLRGSAGIILIWLLRPLLRHWVGARAAHLLWLAALVPLLSPWLPATPFSPLSARTVEVSPATSGFAGAQVFVSVDDAPAQRVAPTKISAPPAAKPIAWLLPLWAMGAMGIGALALLRAIRAARLVHRAPEISSHPAVRSALADLPEAPRGLRIRETGELRSPALCGILHPTILLPVGWWDRLTQEEFRCVLLHEIGHIQRGDLLWRWAFLIAQALHWFNPLVWLAERSARADQELACDEWVLTRADSFDEQMYGEVLLKAASLLGAVRLSSPVHATMAESKAGLTRRIRHLAQIRPHGWSAFIVPLFVAGVAVVIIAPPRSQAEALKTPSAAPASESIRLVQSDPAPALPTRHAMRLQEQQIAIEARFVEISEEDLPALTNGVAAGGKATLPNQFPQSPAITRDAIDTLLFGAKGSASVPGAAITGIFTDPQFQVVWRALNQKKGADLVAAPRVTARRGQRAVIEIIREFRYPTELAVDDERGIPFPTQFETRNTGVTLEVEPEITPDGRIELLLIPQVVEFLGFVNYTGGRPARQDSNQDALATLMEPVSSSIAVNQPIFSKRKISTSVVLEPGQTALVGGMGRSDEQVEDRTLMERIKRLPLANPGPTKVIPRSLYIFVTARLLDPAEVAILAPAADAKPLAPAVGAKAPAAPPVAPVVGALLSGTPVPGKPGFITSPYAPTVGYIDVRGYPPGTEVKCPYSGKILLVP